ncbi:MAG: hypothetical protein DME45_02160 [Verrucomicrobia bacterium]|nr:MAG: hypothetical protein DME45_02160 [Verrucomicrobiota bacterium]
MVPQIKDFPPKRPILPIPYQALAYWILAYIMPLLLVGFFASQYVIEETLLPVRAGNAVQAQRF